MADHKQTALKAKITRLRNASKKPSLTLAEKIAAKELVKAAEQELRDYRLGVQQAKADARTLPKRIKATAKAIDNMAREISREQLRAVCRKPPAEFQQWGVIRTQAWAKLATTGNRLVKRQRPKAEEMQSIIWRLSMVPKMELETCQQIVTPPKKK